MAFAPIRLGKEEIFETIVLDSDGRKLENWKCMKKDFPKVVKILNSKFGLRMTIKEQEENKDLDWAL